jgi:hypothetical protein
MFGEENTTLVHMLVQLFQIEDDMAQLNRVAGEVADTANDLLATYREVNAGIDAVRNYSFDALVSDLKVDLYRQYPGFAKLEGASQSLGRWEETFTSSPFTAYEAIGAVVGDLSSPLRAEIAVGRARVDEELLLRGEASGGLAAAYTAEQATEKLDRQIKDLAGLAGRASPAQAAQISARAGLLVAAEQSYVMRLLSRAVRFHSVDAAIEYGRRIQGRNSAYQARAESVSFAREALSPPPLINFASVGSEPSGAPEVQP